MISFRYHLVSLVAVLAALAAGVALGSGPLQRSELGLDTSDSDAEALAESQRQVRTLTADGAFGESYAEATAPSVLGGSLTGSAVTLVTLPGADGEQVARLIGLVGAAGGRVTGKVEFTDRLLDVGNRQLVSELATQLAETVEGEVEVPASAGDYERLGSLVAEAIATTQAAGDAVGEAGDGLLAGLQTAELVSGRGLERRGSLLLVVAGEPAGSEDARVGAGRIVSAIVGAVDERAAGVVVAGPVASGAEDGVVGVLRADPTVADRVSSVDALDGVAGAVVAVLALGTERSGTAGHYGTSASPDGAVPGATSP